jgi:hypothetical protein
VWGLVDPTALSKIGKTELMPAKEPINLTEGEREKLEDEKSRRKLPSDGHVPRRRAADSAPERSQNVGSLGFGLRNGSL